MANFVLSFDQKHVYDIDKITYISFRNKENKHCEYKSASYALVHFGDKETYIKFSLKDKNDKNDLNRILEKINLKDCL